MSPQPPATAATRDEDQGPAWLEPAYLSRVVGEAVRTVDAKALGAGDNFASAMVRVQVTTDAGEDRHLIVKQLPPNTVEDYFPIARAFDNEGHVYANILPRVNERLRAIGRAEPPLAPAMLHRRAAPGSLLIFEDISVKGFRLAAREQNLDEAHTRLILRSLARLHAAGALVLDAEPQLFANEIRLVAAEHDKLLDGMMVKGYARFLSHADRWTDDLSRRTVAKLRLLQPDCGERLVKAHHPAARDSGAFSTCLHGDLWSGNALFKYDADGKPTEVRFIDFQITTWGSPASDLHYFVGTSVGGETRARLDTLLAEYHAELAACLTAMGAKRVPTLEEIKADLRLRGMAEVVHMVSSMPTVLAPHSVGLTFENIVDVHRGDGPHPRDLAMSIEPVRDTARQFFAAWEQEGLLDALIATGP